MAVGCGGDVAGVVPPVPCRERVGDGAGLGALPWTSRPPRPCAGVAAGEARAGPRALAWPGSTRLRRLGDGLAAERSR